MFIVIGYGDFLSQILLDFKPCFWEMVLIRNTKLKTNTNQENNIYNLNNEHKANTYEI